MNAIALCELPADSVEARAWVVARVAALAAIGEAELVFIGTDHGNAGKQAAETIAVRFASVERTGAVLSKWRDDGMPAAIKVRVLRLEPVRWADFNVAIFS